MNQRTSESVTSPKYFPIENLTPRGKRTRALILKSAREVLEENGYHNSTVTQMQQKSGLALGTFYRYFPNKEEAYMELLRELVETLYVSAGGAWQKSDPLGSLRSATFRYLTTYYENRRLIAALQEMAGVVPECAALWWELRQRIFARMLARVESQAVSSGIGDAEAAVSALGGMVERFAQYWYLEGENFGAAPPDLATAAESLSQIWYRALYDNKGGGS